MKEIKTPFGPIGEFVYKRTYSRKINDEGDETESFPQTIDRVLTAARDQLKVPDLQNKQYFEKAREILLTLRGSVAGRFLWQLGTKTVDKLGLMSLQNCAFVVVDEPVRPFTWAFDALMLGSGVGFNIQLKNVYSLPPVKAGVMITKKDTKDADFIIPDSREGWGLLLEKTLTSYFITGESFSYSTILVRGAGEPISGFGGTASGPGPLVKGIRQIGEILNKKAGKKIAPIDALDIMNVIGSVVVAGNVRRSAQIALGDAIDKNFLEAKRWDLGGIPSYRAMSNNSVIVSDIDDLPEHFWEGYVGNGEPYGLINLPLSRKVGRLGETQYPDADVHGYNPSLRAGTKVWTSEGIVPIEELQDKNFTVTNLYGNKSTAKCWLSGRNKQLYRLKLDSGMEYYATPEHKWPVHTKQGWVKVETSDLKPGHLLPIIQRDSLDFGTRGDYEDGFLIGWLYSDGWITSRGGKPHYGFITSKKDREYGIDKKLLTKLHSLGFTGSGSERDGNLEIYVATDSVHEYMRSFGVSKKENGLPSSIWKDGSEEFRKGFIDAMISADGSVDKGYKTARINLSQSNKKLITDIAELLGFYGIKTTYHKISTKGSFPNGKDYNRAYERHTIRVTLRESIDHFRSLFKLSVGYKQEALDKISKTSVRPLHGRTVKIKEVELTDIYEDVWDVTVFDDTHCFQLSHVITGNCAEQSLGNYETCCLSEIFLPNNKSKEKLWEVVELLYKINKHSLALPCHLKETEAIVNHNMRMGIGITGYLQSSDEQKSWLSETYTRLRAFDVEYSKANGFNTSIKLTTVELAA